MELKKLMVDSKAVWIDFSGLEGFSVEVANLSKKELTSIRKKCTEQKFDRKTRQLIEELNEEKFVENFTRAVIKNWKGLKLSYLETLLLIDMGSEDPNKELDYSEENAETLVNSSTEFDTWLNEVVFDLENFRTGSKKPAPRATGKITEE
jgi:hypothetical protein